MAGLMLRPRGTVQVVKFGLPNDSRWSQDSSFSDFPDLPLLYGLGLHELLPTSAMTIGFGTRKEG